MRRHWRVLAWLALSLAAYAPMLDNGFLEDDYVVLERSLTVLENPAYLWQIPPETFRGTTYLVFGLLRTAFGYEPFVFHLFAILLHAVNAYLFWKLMVLITGQGRAADISAVLFTVVQNPNEALMWPAAMNEQLLALFLLATLLAWVKKRVAWSLFFYCAALASKESAPLLIVLVPVVDRWHDGKAWFRSSWLLFMLPTGIFALLFVGTLSRNALVAPGLVAFTWNVIPTFLLALHKLSFPWLYLALILALGLVGRHALLSARFAFTWLILSLLPYSFVTYSVASRHLYVASLALCATLAIAFAGLPLRLRQALVVVFVIVNIGYLWGRKDGQFERRAAPTEQLLGILRTSPPRCLGLEGYDRNPWILKLTARRVCGWDPGMIRVSPPDPISADCTRLHWKESAAWEPAP